VQKVLDVLKILSDETRLKIICLLAQNELCVCELMEALRMSQSRISNHLRVLRDTGIIHSRREGKWIFYYLAPDKMDKVVWGIIEAVDSAIFSLFFFLDFLLNLLF